MIAAVVFAACSPGNSNPAPTTAPRPSSSSPATGAVTISESASIDFYAWAPDGRHLLIDSDGLVLIDSTGKTVASPDGMIATWVDPQHFATWSESRATSASGSVAVYDLGGSSIAVPGSYSGLALVGDGVGSLALLLPAATGKDVHDHFVVWQNGVLSNPLPGLPLGWSRDGSTLIVATSQPLGGLPGGPQSVSIAVLHRPFGVTSEQPVKSVHVDPTYVPVFNATGTEVAFQCGAIGQLGGCHQLVLDLRTGQPRDVASELPGLPLSWLPDGGLLLAADGATGSGVLDEWNGSMAVATALPRASWGLAASSGAIALVTEAPDATRTTQVFGPVGTPIGQARGLGVAWSADGSSLAVEADSGDQLTIFTIPGGS